MSKLVQAYVAAGAGRQEPQRTVTFSVRLTEYQHEKLMYLAEKLGAPKTRLAQQLLNASMDEASRAMVIQHLEDMHGSEALDFMHEDEFDAYVDNKLREIRAEISQRAGLFVDDGVVTEAGDEGR